MNSGSRSDANGNGSGRVSPCSEPRAIFDAFAPSRSDTTAATEIFSASYSRRSRPSDAITALETSSDTTGRTRSPCMTGLEPSTSRIVSSRPA